MGTYSTSEAINAGLDLEVPGPSIWRGKQLIAAVECRKVSTQAVDSVMRNLLKLMHRTCAAQEAPIEDRKGDTPESRDLVRKVTADLIVLLKNERNIPLLAKGARTKYCLIGEHFENLATCGGGSSESAPFYILTPIDAITEVIGTQNAYYEPGC